LKDLLKDGRKSFANIAKECGVTKSTIWKHYREMKNSGIIKGATTQIDYRSFGYDIVSELTVTVKLGQANHVTEYIQKMPSTYCVGSTSTSSRLYVIATLRDLSELETVREAIRKLPSVVDVRTDIWTGLRSIPENLTVSSRPRETTKTEESKVERNTTKKITSQIDEIDTQIAKKLTDNGNISFRRIAEELGISTYTVARRYAKLKENGIIKVVIQIDPTKIGYQGMAIFQMVVASQMSSSEIVESLAKIPDVVVILKITGKYDFEVGAFVRDIEHLLSIQNEISKVVGIIALDAEIYEIYSPWPNPRECISTF
jgi:Lrp/AsnC family transcriptional regulator for asnA, asnC and gidA